MCCDNSGMTQTVKSGIGWETIPISHDKSGMYIIYKPIILFYAKLILLQYNGTED